MSEKVQLKTMAETPVGWRGDERSAKLTIGVKILLNPGTTQPAARPNSTIFRLVCEQFHLQKVNPKKNSRKRNEEQLLEKVQRKPIFDALQKRKEHSAQM